LNFIGWASFIALADVSAVRQRLIRKVGINAANRRTSSKRAGKTTIIDYQRKYTAMTLNDRPTYHSFLHTVAVLLTAATFPLIFLGGLVTTHDAGMSVPDWPNSYGYNMFLFPVSQWVGGIFYEHLHRLMGMLVGFLGIMLVLQAFGPARDAIRRRRLGWTAIILGAMAIAWGGTVLLLERAGAIDLQVGRKLQHGFVGLLSLSFIFAAAWMARRRDDRTWVRRLCVTVLVAVCIQGLLGGLRVTEVNLTLAIIHGCFAQAFFCFAGITMVVTSRWWIDATKVSDVTMRKAGRRVTVLAGVCVAAVFGQLAIGAIMRHHDAGLAIPDLPLAYGKLLPPTDAAGLAAVNQYRAWTLQEKSVTMAQIWLHFAHRVGAIVVSAMIAGLLMAGGRRFTDRKLRTPLAIVGCLLVTQFTLGLLTVYYKKPVEVATAHVAVGALLLLTLAILTTRVLRLYSTVFSTSTVTPKANAPPVSARPVAAGI